MGEHYSHLTDEQRDQIEYEYEKTMIVSVVARRVGCSRQQVRYHLKKHGYELHAYRECNRWTNRHTVLRMLKAGCSYSEIARKIGSTHTRVSEFADRYNLPYSFDQFGVPENNPKWRGGRKIDKDGYVMIHEPDHPNATSHGYIREHRKAMSEHLGRPLTDEEVVHHIDGDKKNNEIDNLRLYSSNGEHLADELKGKTPKIHPDNWDQLPKGLARAARKRWEDSQPE